MSYIYALSINIYIERSNFADKKSVKIATKARRGSSADHFETTHLMDGSLTVLVKEDRLQTQAWGKS